MPTPLLSWHRACPELHSLTFCEEQLAALGRRRSVAHLSRVMHGKQWAQEDLRQGPRSITNGGCPAGDEYWFEPDDDAL
ncbi:MAG: hypothetical protein M5U09_13705 [Gammaproteobacteria bacterium]|nr:hypothetical protein [Gammaproteobacteria bacterium]